VGLRTYTGRTHDRTLPIQDWICGPCSCVAPNQHCLCVYLCYPFCHILPRHLDCQQHMPEALANMPLGEVTLAQELQLEGYRTVSYYFDVNGTLCCCSEIQHPRAMLKKINLRCSYVCTYRPASGSGIWVFSTGPTLRRESLN